MACHLIALCGLLGNGIGFLIGPLVLWLVKRGDSPFIDDHGKEAVNFQITMLIYMVVSGVLVIALIGILGLIVFGLMMIIMPIIAGLKANEGQYFRYPMTIRFIK